MKAAELLRRIRDTGPLDPDVRIDAELLVGYCTTDDLLRSRLRTLAARSRCDARPVRDMPHIGPGRPGDESAWVDVWQRDPYAGRWRQTPKFGMRRMLEEENAAGLAAQQAEMLQGMWAGAAGIRPGSANPQVMRGPGGPGPSIPPRAPPPAATGTGAPFVPRVGFIRVFRPILYYDKNGLMTEGVFDRPPY